MRVVSNCHSQTQFAFSLSNIIAVGVLSYVMSLSLMVLVEAVVLPACCLEMLNICKSSLLECVCLCIRSHLD